MAKRADPTSDAVIDAFMEEVENQSDRGAAILAASVLDALLQKVILGRFVPLSNKRIEKLFDGPNKPLSTFSSKIEIAFALGILPEEHRRLLDGIRDIRNSFAHRIESLSFDDPEISKIVLRLGAPRTKQTKSVTIRFSFLSLFRVASSTLFMMLDMPSYRVQPVWKSHRDHLSKQYHGMVDMIQEALTKAQESMQR